MSTGTGRPSSAANGHFQLHLPKSWKCKAIEKEQKKQREAKVSRERSQALSLQTSQRQRAMEDRRLCMVAAEEERRRRILDERKLSQQQATHRFRRATEKFKTTEGRSPSTMSKVTKLMTIPYRTDGNLPALSSNQTQKVPLGKECERLRPPGKNLFMFQSRQRLSNVDNTKIETIPNINHPEKADGEAADHGTPRTDSSQLSELNASRNWRRNSSASDVTHTFQPPSVSSASSNGGSISVSRQASASASKGMNWYQARRASASANIKGSWYQARPDSVSASVSKGVNSYQARPDSVSASVSKGVNSYQARLDSASASVSKGVNSYQARLDSALASNGGNWYQARRAAASSASNNGEHMTQARTASVADAHCNEDKPAQFQSNSIVEDIDEPDDLVFLPVLHKIQQDGVVHSVQGMTMISPDSCSSSQESSSSPCSISIIPDSLNSSVEDTELKVGSGSPRVRFTESIDIEHFEYDEDFTSSDSLNEDSDMDMLVEPIPIPSGGPRKTKLVGILTNKSKSSSSSCSIFPSSSLFSHFYTRTNLSAINEDICETKTTSKPQKKVRFLDEVDTCRIKKVIPAGCAIASRIPLWKTPLPRDNSPETLPNSVRMKHMLSSKASTLSQGNPPQMQGLDIPSAMETDLTPADLESIAPKEAASGEVATDNTTCADDQGGEETECHKSLDQTPTDEDIESMWTKIHQNLHNEKKLTLPSKIFSFRHQTMNGSGPRVLYNGSGLSSAHINKKNGVKHRLLTQHLAKPTQGGYGEVSSRLPLPQAGVPKKAAVYGTPCTPYPAEPMESSTSNHKLTSAPVLSLSLEEKHIRESLERIDQKLEGHPGSVSSISCSTPSPPTQINPFLHHRMSFSSGLHNNYHHQSLSEDDDYF